MKELLEWMQYIEDVRQAGKVRHKLKDILVIVLLATSVNADDWLETELFVETYEEYLQKGILFHDTITVVTGMIAPEIVQQLYNKWQELLNRNEGKILKKIICVDGKTMRSTGNKKSKNELYCISMDQRK